MSGSIKIDGLADAVMDALHEYRDLAFSVVEDAVEQTAQESVKELRGNISAAGIGGTGKYRRSAAQKKTDEGGTYTFSRRVFVKSPLYRLTHLLEKGHDIKNRKGGPVLGRVKAYPHWEQTEDFAEKRALQLIKEGLKRRGGGSA